MIEKGKFHHQDTKNTKVRIGGVAFWHERILKPQTTTDFSASDRMTVRKVNSILNGAHKHELHRKACNTTLGFRPSCPLCLCGEYPSVNSVSPW
jgi:hypothetical protein